MIFEDRRQAGKLLSEELGKYKQSLRSSELKQSLRSSELKGEDTVVLGIPRGGVVTAVEVARALEAPLDIVVTRKLGAPGNPELAIGAIDGAGNTFLHEGLINRLGVDEAYLEKIKREEQKEAKRRERVFRGEREPLALKGKTAIIVDDGIATGATTLAAVRSVKVRNPKKVVLAVPVAPPDSVKMLKKEVDELVVLSTPAFFAAVGQFYRKFDQTTDEEVKRMLNPKQH